MDDREREMARVTRAVVPGELLGPLFHRAWWALALRGLLGILLGIVAISVPGVTLAVLLAVLGVYFVFDGIFALVATFRAAREDRTWWPYLLEGLVSMAVGVLVFARPAAAVVGVLVLVAVRSLITGVVEIATGVWLRRETGRTEWPLWLAGVLSIVFGVFLLARPAAGVLTLAWLIGIYIMAFGIIVTASAFRLRGAARRGLVRQPQPT
jgi:uncharacterized membrane protein HdeD (DUF308 family)